MTAPSSSPTTPTAGRNARTTALADRGTRRYTPERGTAYLLYRTVAARSVSKVAALTGMSARTIESRRVDDGWPARTDRDAAAADQALASILTAMQIRDEEQASNKDRLSATVWLAGLAGVSPDKATALAPAKPQPTEQFPATTDPDELQRQMQVLIERSRGQGASHQVLDPVPASVPPRRSAGHPSTPTGNGLATERTAGRGCMTLLVDVCVGVCEGPHPLPGCEIPGTRAG